MAGIDFKSVISNWCLALLLGLAVNAQTPAMKINLNTATAAQLETLPGIGTGLAKRILEHRAKHGSFKRPQDLIVIRGFSAKRYRLIAPYVTT
ncbi:MAG: helix-hairpin-helix domain-containing protein [Acidobacteria bacterium]|nr:helix-hairpin-helix domain-containing protein [Acidobacteriota bacterium]